MSSVSLLNPRGDIARSQFSLQINTSAARGLQDVLTSNLGPKGTMKMLVSGGGDIIITKDGSVLLSEMQLQHPTASLISRVASAQDDITGDGTTSTVLLVGEILRQAELLISEGMHPRLISQGLAFARNKALEILPKFCTKFDPKDRNTLACLARASLNTKVRQELADILTEVVVDAVLAIKGSADGEIDLHMVEIMEMIHKSDTNTRLVKGLVMDHGGRHPSMPSSVTDAFILTLNVSLEFEKTEINSGYFYKNVEERQKMVAGERKCTDEKIQKIIDLKRKVCLGNSKGFVIVNQKGIDPLSLEALASEGILALRRAKRRNMERLVAACGGVAMNSVDDLTPECLGHAGNVSEFVLGEEKFTFVQDVVNSGSVTILINGPAKYILSQIKHALRDGLRAVNNAFKDGCVLPGAGAVEVALHEELLSYAKTISSKEQLGIVAFANALLVIPRTLARNSGLDAQDVFVKLSAEYIKKKLLVGVDLVTGNPVNPVSIGIYDNYCVKRLIISGACDISSNLLLVDEIIRAGISSVKGQDKMA